MNALQKNIENFTESNPDNFVTQKCALWNRLDCIQGKMKDSVLFELALEAMKNTKNNLPFFIHLILPFSSISCDVLGLVRSKIRRGFLLCRLESVKPCLQRVMSHFVMYYIYGSARPIPTYQPSISFHAYYYNFLELSLSLSLIIFSNCLLFIFQQIIFNISIFLQQLGLNCIMLLP